MAITKYGVYNASFRLLKELQRKPTRSEVHKALGGGGSRGTIQKYMRAWEEEHASTIAVIDGGGIDLPDPLVALVVSIHETVTAEAAAIAADGIAAGDKRFDEANLLVESAQDEAARVREDAAAAISVAQAKVEALQDERIQLLGRIASLEDALSTWRGLAEKHQKQVTTLSEESRTLYDQITELREQLREANLGLASMESAQNRLTEAVSQSEQLVAASKTELEALRQHQASIVLAHQGEAQAWLQEKLKLNQRIEVLSAHAEALEQHINDSC